MRVPLGSLEQMDWLCPTIDSMSHRLPCRVWSEGHNFTGAPRVLSGQLCPSVLPAASRQSSHGPPEAGSLGHVSHLMPIPCAPAGTPGKTHPSTHRAWSALPTSSLSHQKLCSTAVTNEQGARLQSSRRSNLGGSGESSEAQRQEPWVFWEQHKWPPSQSSGFAQGSRRGCGRASPVLSCKVALPPDPLPAEGY